MNAYEYSNDLIKSNAVLDYETFTDRALKAILADDLNQERFVDMLDEFNSFEGLSHKFCINFNGAWLKYALNGIHNKERLKSHKLIRDILGDDFQEKERGGGIPPPQISNEIYQKTNWISEISKIQEDENPQRSYIIQRCKKHQKSNNSYQDINIILLRPKDFLEVMTSSKCVSEYRKYFITLAEIRRSYQDTYLPWIIRNKDNAISRLEQKIDTQMNMITDQKETIAELLSNSRSILSQNVHLIGTVEDNKIEISKLHTKVDTMFEFLLSFARMVIPVMIGSTVVKQQLTTLTNNKSISYALKHLKVLFMVGFYDSYEEPTNETKIVDDNEIRFAGHGHIKIYACCTNFADVGARIRTLYKRYSDNDTNIMYMLKPTVVSLISCEINSERIILENSKIFPTKSIVRWDSRYKCYDITVSAKSYDQAHTMFDTICTKASAERFQSYQMRLDEYNRSDNIKMNSQITEYLNQVDSQFFAETNPFAQQYINSYVIRSMDASDDLIEWCYATANRKCKRRSDMNNENLSTSNYTLRKIELLIDDHSSKDHIKHMTETNIISKEDLPALKALAKFDNIDTSSIQVPNDVEA